MSFVHLRATSAYSLLRGAIKMPELVALAKQNAMPALGLSDHDNLFGSLEFSELAVKAGVQPIVGMAISVPREPEALCPSASERLRDTLVCLAKNTHGFENLIALGSDCYLNPAAGQPPLLGLSQIAARTEGLIALSGGLQGSIARHLLAGRQQEARDSAAELAAMFPGRFYLEITRHGTAEESACEAALLTLALELNLPLVATNHIYFEDAQMYAAHDALCCIASGHYVTESNRPRLTREHYFKSASEMRELFHDLPEAIDNTLQIARRCCAWAPSRTPILPGFSALDDAGQVLSESDALRNRAREGLAHRLAAQVFNEQMDIQAREQAAAPYLERLEFELDVIITMKFPGYFLIVSDFISWAKDQGIPVGPGRGSGAGSVVAWALRITDLDPLRYGLIFERFLNPERVSMPDFDIDFCQDRRDEVIRYVQQKYGDDRVAQIITFGKLQARAVLRDVGRVLQMPYSQVDRICKLVPNNPADPVTLPQAIAREPLLKAAIEEDESSQQLVSLAQRLEGLYRHASTHAAGVVIGDRPLSELVPLYCDPRSQMLVVQYSMKWAEAAGLVKFDFLGLRTLTILAKAVDIIHATRGERLDLLNLPEGDARSYAMLTRGDTLGVFQFESAGMRDALKNLKPDSIEDLIALGALYRPGPMDNIPTYIEVKHGRARPNYLHPLLEPVLRETYGVIIYQEQVQKIAQILAGYTLGGADLLRRAMGKKIKSEMDAQRATFVEGAKKNGVDAGQAAAIFDLVAKFAGYGFNKSHAAAYAVIAYQTAYLKANYTVEFLAASMTYEMVSTDKLALFAAEARKFGIAILPPDINKSEGEFVVEFASHDEKNPQHAQIRYALAAIKNVGAAAMGLIVAERAAHGPFADIYDFVTRVDASVMNRRQMEYLIFAGAFDSLEPNRRCLYESLDMLLALAQQATQERASPQVSLFGEPGTGGGLPRPALMRTEDWPAAERLRKEQEALGFYLNEHPLSPYQTLARMLGAQSSTRLSQPLADRTALKLTGLLSAIKMRSGPRGRSAFLTCSDPEGTFEVAIFDETLLDTTLAELKTGALLLIAADARTGERGQRLIATRIEPLAQAVSRVGAPSRIVLRLEETAALTTLAAQLGAPVAQGAQVELRLKLNGGTVRLALPGRYGVNAQQLLQLERLPDIEALTA